MRSYAQYCPLARALDVIGERWTLLVVRELLVRGPCRYTDLREGLPGIATNLLANRLRALEAAGVVVREDAPPPVATSLFRLTERGRALRPVLLAIGSWGGPLLAKRSRGDAFHTLWLALPLEDQLTDHMPTKPPAAIELLTGDEPVTIEVSCGSVSVRRGPAEAPDAVLSGDPLAVVGVLTGKLSLNAARTSGLRFEGSSAVLERVRPKPVSARVRGRIDPQT